MVSDSLNLRRSEFPRSKREKCLYLALALLFAALTVVFALSIVFVYLHATKGDAGTDDTSQSSSARSTPVDPHNVFNLTGRKNSSIVFNTSEPIRINLRNVSIETTDSAAIVQLGTGETIINVEEGTRNVLSNGENGTHEGCIYSFGPLVIQGSGTLYVTGRSKIGEGISTENQPLTIRGNPTIVIQALDDGINTGGNDGAKMTIEGGNITVFAKGDGLDSNQDIVITGGFLYTSSVNGDDTGLDSNDGIAIKGGEVVSLGLGIFEPPEEKETTQTSLAFQFDSVVPKGTTLTVMKKEKGKEGREGRENEEEKIIVSFIVSADTRNFILSLPSLTRGNYTIYKGGVNRARISGFFFDTSDSSLYEKGEEVTAEGKKVFEVTGERGKSVYVFGKKRQRRERRERREGEEGKEEGERRERRERPPKK